MPKSFCVTNGREDLIVERYKQISNIVKDNARVPIKEVIKKIADVSMGAWYKYVSKGPQRGKISNVTTTTLAAFSGIPEDVFSAKADFTDEHKKILAAKIKNAFSQPASGKSDMNYKKKPGPKPKKEVAKKTKPYSGKESSIRQRFAEINAIIQKSSGIALKPVIREIAGVSMGSWYNYISNGKVSPKVVSKLSKFTQIPQEVFFAQKEFSADYKKTLAEKISSAFPSKGLKAKRGRKATQLELPEKAPIIKKELSVSKQIKKIEEVVSQGSLVDRVRDFAGGVEQINDLKQLQLVLDMFVKLTNVTQKKVEFLAALKSL